MAETTSAVKPETKPNPGRTALRTNPWWLAGTIILVAWSCLRFPQSTITPLLDPSWTAVLVYAREHGLQFGRDIVCTYGPLGFLSIEYFSPDVAVARIFFEVAIGGGIATGLCLAAWHMTLPWRLVTLGFFMFVAAPIRWGGDALYLDLGLFAWGLLCFLESGPPLRIFVAALAVLAGVGALIKFTFLLTALFTVGLIACDLALRRQRAMAAGLVAGFTFVFVLGWIALGQSLSSIGVYFTTSLGVASGYNEAMGMRFINPAWVFVISLTAFAGVAFRFVGAATPGWRRAMPLLWLAGLLFVEWKYACVRSDWEHVALMLGVTPMVALCMEAVPVAGKRAMFGSRAASGLCVVVTLLFIQSQTDGFALAGNTRQTASNMATSLGILLRPSRYVREKNEAFQAEKKMDQLPKIRALVGRATVDVFGQSQAIAIFNELNYRPRPVFQSYAAYTRRMTELNEQFYLSSGAPEYVLFNLNALDGRFPPLEDALVLRELLANYQLVASEKHYLLLRRNETAKLRLTLLKEGVTHASEKIDLKNYRDANLWLEIELNPTFLGRARRFLYKPLEMQLTVWSQAGLDNQFKFNAPATMLSAGFPASPVMLKNSDVMNFLTTGQGQSLDAFSAEAIPGMLNSWQSEIHFRVYGIEK